MRRRSAAGALGRLRGGPVRGGPVRGGLVQGGLVQGGLVLVGLTLALGCGDSITGADAADGSPGVRGTDAGPAPMDTSDAGGVSFGGDAAASADGLVPELTEGADPDSTGNARSCFDGLDQDGDMLADCADDGCGLSRVCCVGSAATACCSPTAITTTFALETCSGDPTRCDALVRAGLAPRVVSGAPLFGEDHALVPVSTGRVDGVVDFPTVQLSPRGERITVRATISSPATSEQLDATAVGLWTPQPTAASVSPLAAVVVSATRRDVSLVVGDRVVATAMLVAGTTEYALQLAPDGEVSVRVGDATLSAVVALPAGRVVPVVFGRVINDAVASGTTRVTSLAVERHACDLPDALVRTGALTAVGETSYEVLHATDPSVLGRPVGDDLVAFSAPSRGSATRALYLASRGPDGRLEAPVALVTVQSLADLGTPVVATDLGGPELFVEGGAVSMYFAFRAPTGEWRLARLDGVETTPSVTVLPIAAGSYDDPAPLGTGRLLARERLADGGSRLVILQLTPEATTPATGLCASESLCDGARPDAYIHATSTDPLAFDHDEVRAPVAVEHGGVRRIYFAGRRGTRWSIGMLLEGDDGSFFRLANGGEAVLGPSGSGVDALGVAGPSPLVREGELELVHAGTDGAGWQLLSARMPLR